MKKLLALVLALVMTLSLCITSNAAFTDAADVDYDEAVEVLSMVGVFKGYEDGSFKPTKTLTRAEATKLIAYLDLGQKSADALQGSGKVFSDVPASHWAAGYIEYCAAAGYVAGVGDGKFDPNGDLTAVAFAKMLMCVLGYDADYEGFNGSNWSINIVKKANELNLFKGVEKSVNAAATREEAAQYCLNTLKATMVTANKGTSMTVGGVSVTTSGTAATFKTGEAYDYTKADGEADGPNTLQLCEFLYKGKLTLDDSATDSFRRIGNKWTFIDSKGETHTTSVFKSAADYTFTATSTTAEAVNGSGNYTSDTLVAAINKGLGRKVASNMLVGTPTVQLNGANSSIAAGTQQIKNGDVVEVFVGSDAEYKTIKNVVITRYDLKQIDEVKDLSASELKAIAKKVANETIEADSKEALATKKIKLVSDTYYLYDTNFAGFDYAAKDFVLVAGDTNTSTIANNKILASKAATVVEGTVTSTKDSKVCINGTYYTDSTGTSLGIDDKGTFALNEVGALEGVIDTSSSSTYGYIYNIVAKSATDAANGYSSTAVTYTAYMALTDGTLTSYPVATVKGTGGNADNVYFKGNANSATYQITATEGHDQAYAKAVAYTVNSDGKLEIGTAPTGITVTDTGTKYAVTKSAARVLGNVYADANTTFVFVEKKTNDSGDYYAKATVVEGYKGVVTNNTADRWVVHGTDNYADFVFVAAGNGTAASDAVYAVMLDNKAVGTTEDKVNYLTYKVAIDGVEQDLKIKSSGSSDITSLENGTVFSYTMTGSVLTLNTSFSTDGYQAWTASASGDAKKVNNKTDAYIVTDAQVNLAADCDVYTVTRGGDSDEYTWTVTEGGLAKDAIVVVAKTNTDSQATLIFVFVDEAE